MSGCCSHNHDCDATDCGGSSLYEFVNHPQVTALNAADAGAAKRIIRPWNERQQRDDCLVRDAGTSCKLFTINETRKLHLAAFSPRESNDDDPELILQIPFTSDVKIRGILVAGGDGGTAPSRMRAYLNRNDVDFDLANQMAPVQEWNMVEDPSGSTEYQTRPAKFQGVASLTLHFPANYGADRTRIWYVGLRGEGTKIARDGPKNLVYEAKPQISDHKAPSEEAMPKFLQ